MKTKLLKLALCAMTLLPMGAWAIDFGTEEVVSTTTTWTFNDLIATTQYSSYTQINGLYLRTNQTGRSFTVTEGTGTSMTFKDGFVVTAANYLYVNHNATYSNSDALTVTSTAGDGTSAGRGMIAINASVAGTLYVKIKGLTNNKVIRTYFANGSTIVGSSATSITSDGTIQEISYTSSEAGSFFVGGITTGTSEIYAVRFVPTSEKKDDWVYIGATGYATYSNNASYDIPALPAGLSAYAASASNDGHSVVLSERTGMRRTNGYILKGTPNTNYPLTLNGTNLGSAYNGGSMKRAATYSSASYVIPATDGDNFNYLLGSDSGTAKFFVPNGTSALSTKKAFLQVSSALTPAAGARGLDIIVEDETTAINNVATKSINDGKYYNLQGVEVAQPTKGLYIVNGKKVIIK